MPILHEIWNHLAMFRDPTAIALLVAAVSVPVSVGLAWRSWRARRAGEESAPSAKQDLDAIIAGLKERGLIPDGERRSDTVRLKLDDIMRGQENLRRKVDEAILNGRDVEGDRMARRMAALALVESSTVAHQNAMAAAQQAGLSEEEIMDAIDGAGGDGLPAVEEVATEMSAAIRGPVPPPYPRPAGCALERDACAHHPATCGAQHAGLTCTRPPHSAGDHCAGRIEAGVPTVAFRWGHGG